MRSVPAPTAGRTVVPFRLPRATVLTDALLEAAERTPPVADRSGAARFARRLSRAAVGPAAGGGGLGREIRIGAFQVALGAGREAPPADATPFRWSARTARRALGLPAVRACAEGEAGSPAEAVADVVSSISGRGPHRTGWLAHAAPVPRALGRWVRGLPVPARHAVAAEATTWATRLWTSVDWGRLPGARVGGDDEWWDGRAGSVRVALRGRADVRWQPPGATGAGIHLSMLAGWPSESSAAELALSALVPTLRPGGLVPGAVVGWWPDCGKAWVVAVDAPLLDAAADAVVGAFGDMVGSPA